MIYGQPSCKCMCVRVGARVCWVCCPCEGGEGGQESYNITDAISFFITMKLKFRLQ